MISGDDGNRKDGVETYASRQSLFLRDHSSLLRRDGRVMAALNISRLRHFAAIARYALFSTSALISLRSLFGNHDEYERAGMEYLARDIVILESGHKDIKVNSVLGASGIGISDIGKIVLATSMSGPTELIERLIYDNPSRYRNALDNATSIYRAASFGRRVGWPLRGTPDIAAVVIKSRYQAFRGAGNKDPWNSAMNSLVVEHIKPTEISVYSALFDKFGPATVMSYTKSGIALNDIDALASSSISADFATRML